MKELTWFTRSNRWKRANGDWARGLHSIDSYEVGIERKMSMLEKIEYNIRRIIPIILNKIKEYLTRIGTFKASMLINVEKLSSRLDDVEAGSSIVIDDSDDFKEIMRTVVKIMESYVAEDIVSILEKLYNDIKNIPNSDNAVVRALKICDHLAKVNYKEFDKDSLKKLYHKVLWGRILELFTMSIKEL